MTAFDSSARVGYNENNRTAETFDTIPVLSIAKGLRTDSRRSLGTV
jgi:hypothetical protein